MFYWTAPKAFLPQLPTSIATQMGYFAGSRLVDDVLNADVSDRRSGTLTKDGVTSRDLEFDDKLRAFDRQGWRYRYGKYIGRDGWLRMGIERVPFVVSLDPAATTTQRRGEDFGSKIHHATRPDSR